MKKSILFWSCLLLMAGKTATAQDAEPTRPWHHNVYVEIGPKFMSHLSPDLSHFRPQGGYSSHIYVDSEVNIWQASARYELVAPNGHWAFRTGVQYSCCKKQLGYDALDPNTIHLLNDIPSHYLFEVDNDEQLEYLRIRGIVQRSHYLGVPLELRYYFTYDDLPAFRWYLAAEADLDFLVANTNTVNFLNAEMAPYAEQVFSHYDNPDPFNASTYLGAGFQVGQRNGIGVGFSWMLHLVDFGGTSGMLRTDTRFAGNKLQLELVIPIK